MNSSEFCMYEGKMITVHEALELRKMHKLSSRDCFQCVECSEPVRAHKASKTTSHPAHFEHFKRNPECSYSDIFDGEPNLSLSHPILDQYDGASITSFWGWSPQTWGCVGFSQQGRRNTIVSETVDPFVMVIYVTENADEPEEGGTDYRGKVAGFYVVSHELVDRFSATHEKHHAEESEKWRYSLKAIQAYEIIPEDRPAIRDFEPSIHKGNKAQAVSKHSTLLSKAAFEKLKTYSYREVPVYGSDESLGFEITSPTPKVISSKGYVAGGNANGSGYYVPPERDSEKELYILKMSGDVSAFLSEPAEGRDIYKIGLSMSPDTRANFFNKAMPRGQFVWEVVSSTCRDGDKRYPDFKTAEKGEMAMKVFLSENADKHLGGEFYLASKSVIDQSWFIGRNAAIKNKIV
ncbi:MAG: hypothetical protein ACI9SP_003263 [Arenicella sp.]